MILRIRLPAERRKTPAPFVRFVYLFHMAVFFIASGYCFSSKKSESGAAVGRFVKRKFRTLWAPYVFWTAAFSLLHNVFIKINVYTDNPLALQTIIAVVFLLIGFACSVSGHSLAGIDRVLSCYILFHGGVLLKRSRLEEKIQKEILHFLAFKIVSWIGVIVKGNPPCLIARFPVLYEYGYWWIAYWAVQTVTKISLNR